MSNLHTVVIVGRMNVGKSTLFNRLSHDIKSIVLDYAGVTRDFIRDTSEWRDKKFEIVDTGGISLRKSTDPLLEQVRHVALQAIEHAHVVLFMVDGTIGVLPEDREIARMLHKLNTKIILVINKADSGRTMQHEHEFKALGLPFTVLISAQHGTNINELLDAIVEFLPTTTAEAPEKEAYKVTLLGKPNVGKSSLMNALLQQERSIVSPIAGTTREAISEKVILHKQHLLLTDTPGIRRKRSVGGDLEPLMVKSAFQALKDSDIIVLILDTSESKLCDQELKLAFYAFTEKYKALILLLNKQDLINEQITEEMKRDIDYYGHLTSKVSILPISCVSGKNIGKVLPLIKKVWETHSQKFSNEEINRLIIGSLHKKPLIHQEQPLRVHSARQVATAPITIAMWVNEPEWFGQSQIAFFEKVMREEYGLIGVPVRFVLHRGAERF